MWKYSNRYLRHIRISIVVVTLLFSIYFLNNLIDDFNLTQNLQVMTEAPYDLQKNESSKLLKVKLEPVPKYNLMEEAFGRKWLKKKKNYFDSLLCTIEYANEQKLQQDHPCVLHLIKNKYLRQPASRNSPYKLNYPEIMDPSDGQSKGILRLLRNKTNGFFIECGGDDGEYLSNTLFMERTLNWTGLLIEANKNAFHLLSTRNRKAYLAPLCLSTQPYPMQGMNDLIIQKEGSKLLTIFKRLAFKYFHTELDLPSLVLFDTTHALLSSIVTREEDPQQRKIDLNQEMSSFNNTETIYKTQCFPLYSILLAIGKTKIDYFGLDVEGSEYKILRTIPWRKVDIKTLTVEWDHTPEGQANLTNLMEKNKFVKFGNIEMAFSREVLYVQDFLDDLRLYE